MSRTLLGTIVAIVLAVTGWGMYLTESRDSRELRQQTGELSTTVDGLRGERDELGAAVAELRARNEELAGAGERLAALQGDRDRLEAERTELAAALAEVRALFDAASGRVSELEDTVAGFEASDAQHAARLAERDAELAAARQRVIALETEADGLRTQTAEARAALEAAGSGADSSAYPGTRSRSMAQVLRGRVAALQSRLNRERAEAARDLADLESHLDSARQRIGVLEGQAAAADRLEGEVDTLRSHVAELEAQNREIESVRDRLQAQVGVPPGPEPEGASGPAAPGAAAAPGEVDAESAAARSTADRLASELEAVRGELATSTLELAELRETRSRLEKELENADLTEQQVDELESRLRAANAGIGEREQALVQSRQRIAELEAELAAMEQRIAGLEREKRTALDEKEELERRLASEVERRDLEVRQLRNRMTLVRIDSDIAFAFGSTALSARGAAILDRLAEYLNRYPDRIVSLEGHTDSVPIAEVHRHVFPSNWELSAARAARAARYLQQKGVGADRLRIVGYGPYRPVADNDEESGRARNRRLEIVLAPADTLQSTASLGAD